MSRSLLKIFILGLAPLAIWAQASNEEVSEPNSVSASVEIPQHESTRYMLEGQWALDESTWIHPELMLAPDKNYASLWRNHLELQKLLKQDYLLKAYAELERLDLDLYSRGVGVATSVNLNSLFDFELGTAFYKYTPRSPRPAAFSWDPEFRWGINPASSYRIEIGAHRQFLRDKKNILNDQDLTQSSADFLFKKSFEYSEFWSSFVWERYYGKRRVDGTYLSLGSAFELTQKIWIFGEISTYPSLKLGLTSLWGEGSED